MPTFDEREKGFEGKFAHERELEFKVKARRNKLLGAWAAEILGLKGKDAEAYAREVVESDFRQVGEEDVFEKVWADLQGKSVNVTEHKVRKQMAELLETARAQVMKQ